MEFRSHLWIFMFVTLFACVKSDRKVTAELNPGCRLEQCKNSSIVIVFHVKAVGKNNTIHHLWDFTGKPSFLVAVTENNATLTIDWERFIFAADRAVIIEPTPSYVYGVSIDKIIEFNDEANTGELNENTNNSSYVTLLDTKNFNWKNVNMTNTSRDATLTIEASEFVDTQTKLKKNGTVRFVMSAYGAEDHSESLPHLLHSGNASQLDLTLDGLATNYKYSRFGIHLITVSSDNRNSTIMPIKYRKTMDDEHAPGVFTIVEMLTPSVQKDDCGGYLQWRPIVYTSATRDMTSSTESTQYSVRPSAEPLASLNGTLILSALFDQLNNMLVTETNVTFGVASDGFYAKNKYAAWTMILGYGHPPEEQFSMLVTLVLLIGLGLPAILILTGTVCIVFRRLQRNKDDLFLSR